MRPTPLCSRRALLGLSMAGLAAVTGGFPAAAAKKKTAMPDKYHVYIGTYTQRGSKGIYRMEMDPATGRLTEPVLAAETASPSFLALHPDGRFVYAVGEVSEFNGEKAGSVVAFSRDPKSGALTLLNRQSSRGTGPCHLVVDRTGKRVLVANYGGGNVAVLPIQQDGSLGPATGFFQHRGTSVNPQRQEGPHAHSINVDRDNRYAFAADLGLDKVLVYRFDAERGTVEPNEPDGASVKPGAGPRHFAFHPSGRYAYVINELGNTVTAFSYDAKRGTLQTIQDITTLPADFKGASYTAEVVVHPSGKFLYGSNRGHDSLAIFRIDEKTGQLTPAGHQPTGGKFPRNFNIDPSGRFLLAANQDGDNLLVFRVDPATGALTPTGQEIKIPMPVCIKFAPAE